MQKQLIEYVREFEQCNYADIIDYFSEINQCGSELKAKYLQDLIWFIANEEIREDNT